MKYFKIKHNKSSLDLYIWSKLALNSSQNTVNTEGARSKDETQEEWTHISTFEVKG